MAFNSDKAESFSSKEETPQLKRLGLPRYRSSTPLSFNSPMYEVEQTPFVDTIEKEATGGSQDASHRVSWVLNRDEAARPRRWSRIAYAVVGTLSIIIWFIVMYAFSRAGFSYSTVSAGYGLSSSTQNRVYWVLQGSLKQFDPVAGTLTVNWSPMEITNNGLMPFGTTQDNTWEFGIYRDEGLVPDTPESLKQINITHPELNGYAGMRIQNSTAVPIGIVGQHPHSSVSTDIDMGQLYAGDTWSRPAFGYPLDVWSGDIMFVGQFHDLARTANLSTSFGTSMDDAYLVDNILNWEIYADVHRFSNHSSTEGPWQLKIRFEARRPSLVMFCAFLACIVNWISTIFIFIMTCEGVIMRRAKVIEGAQLLAVCFTALFALPSVRSLYPGAPEFGCLNMMGIIPNVIIVSICTTMIAISTLMVESQKRHAIMVVHDRSA